MIMCQYLQDFSFAGSSWTSSPHGQDARIARRQTATQRWTNGSLVRRPSMNRICAPLWAAHLGIQLAASPGATLENVDPFAVS